MIDSQHLVRLAFLHVDIGVRYNYTHSRPYIYGKEAVTLRLRLPLSLHVDVEVCHSNIYTYIYTHAQVCL